ncbi:MAG TPA: PEP-CTERM sorting domain-containing protein [Vicinamibacterales bacterium]|nr:PEP-CTERM sorting domain-containing protein [Vicinamibacterales bacterium]
MNKLILLSVAMLGAFAHPSSAATISFTAPATVSGAFDLTVQAQDVFAGRDLSTDIAISFGFDVGVSDPSILSFLGATSGPLFDAATSEPGTDVFAAAFGQHGFGIEPGASEPVLLATLHFKAHGSGPATIVISSDLSNLFQGLQFFDAPFQDSIDGRVAVSAVSSTPVPEPATLLLSAIGLIGIASRRAAR